MINLDLFPPGPFLIYGVEEIYDMETGASDEIYRCVDENVAKGVAEQWMLDNNIATVVTEHCFLEKNDFPGAPDTSEDIWVYEPDGVVV